MIALAKRAISATGNTALCIAGGVGLNCKANGAILQQAGCCCVFVQPAANDAGTALGAALVLAARMGTLAPTPLQHTHFGPAFSQDDIQNTLEHACLDYQTPHDIAQATADLVARDQVVGWFQGHMEFGSRALGGRSILANPANPNINAIVNGRVKFREAWRPFCPSMTAGTENNWLAHAQPAPFMTTAFAAQAGWQDTLPSVVHVDGTVRPQTVSPDRLPPERPESRFYDVIEHLGTHIGHPVVLNTSLNVRGEPIVCRPSEAIACFLSTDMDALAIGDFLLTKRA